MNPETKLILFVGGVFVLGLWFAYLMHKPPRKLPPPVADHRDTLHWWRNSWRA